MLEASEGVCMGLWWKILRGESEVEREKHYTVWVISELMYMGQWLNDTERGIPTSLQKSYRRWLVDY